MRTHNIYIIYICIYVSITGDIRLGTQRRSNCMYIRMYIWFIPMSNVPALSNLKSPEKNTSISPGKLKFCLVSYDF